MPMTGTGRRNVSIPDPLWDRLLVVARAAGDGNRSRQLRLALEDHLAETEEALEAQGKIEKVGRGRGQHYRLTK